LKRFCPEGHSASLFSSSYFAHSGEILFFAPPKKSIQKKGDPGGLPATRVPCASRKARRSRNSLRSNRRELPPVFTAMLGCARRVGELKTNTQNPPQPIRDQARTLSEAGLPAELCAPPEGRGTQGIGIADECTGVPFSLGTFSWALKRKYLARMGEIKRYEDAHRPSGQNKQMNRELPHPSGRNLR